MLPPALFTTGLDDVLIDNPHRRQRQLSQEVIADGTGQPDLNCVWVWCRESSKLGRRITSPDGSLDVRVAGNMTEDVRVARKARQRSSGNDGTVPAVHDIRGCDRVAVGEPSIRPEWDGVGEAVGGNDRHLGGDIRNHSELVVHPEQAVEEVLGNRVVRRVKELIRIERLEDTDILGDGDTERLVNG